MLYRSKGGTKMSEWKIIGPGGGGTTYNPTISPHDPNVIYTHCDMTGNYLSKDGGKHWRQFNLNGVAYAFAFCPKDPNVMYAGANGLYKSIDGGTNWRQIFPHPDRSTKYLNGDHGATYFDVPDGHYPGGGVRKIAVDPVDPQIVYVLMNPATPTVVYTIQNMNTQELYISQDGGENFAFACQVPVCNNPDGPAVIENPYQSAHASSQVLRLYADHDGSVYIFQNRSRWIPDAEGNIAYAGEISRYNRMDGTFTVVDTGTLMQADVIYDEKAKKSVFYLLRREENEKMPHVVGVLYKTTDFKNFTRLTYEFDTSFMETSKLIEGNHPKLYMNFVGAANENVIYLSLYACESFHGIIKTQDGGKTWDWCYRGAFFWDHKENYGNYNPGWIEYEYSIGWGAYPWGFQVSKTNPDYAYISNMGSFYGTKDGGKNWNPLYSVVSHKDGRLYTHTTGLDITSVHQLAIDPFDPKHLILCDTDIGQFKSVDGGKDWTHSVEGIPRNWVNTNYWTIFDPAVRGRMWSVWSNTHDMPRLKVIPPRNNMTPDETQSHGQQRNCGGVAYSEDGGWTWKTLTGNHNPDSGFPEAVTVMIDIDPASPVDARILYAATMGQGVYKSIDGGKTWAQKNRGLVPTIGRFADGTQMPMEYGNMGLFAWALHVRGDKLYLTTARSGAEQTAEGPGQLYVSNDGAESWEMLTMPGNANFVNGLAFDPSDPNRFYAGCWKASNTKESGDYRPASGGVYRTDDGGQAWTLCLNPEQSFYGLLVDPKNTNTVYAVNFHADLMKSTDWGINWSKVEGYDFYWGHRPFIDPLHDGYLYVTTFGGGVWHGPVI